MINIIFVGMHRGKDARGGIVHFNNLLLKFLDSNKFNLKYFSLGKNPIWYRGNKQSSQFLFYLLHFKKLFDFLIKIKKNKIQIANINSNLIQASLFRDGIFSMLAKYSGCKTCFLLHGWKDFEFNKILKNPIKKKIFIFLMNKQDSIGVLANDFKNKLVTLGIDPDKIFIFSTMVESKTFFPEIDKFDTDSFNILFCAHPLRKKKGIFEFISSIPLIIDKYPKTKFIILGSGDKINLLKKKSEMLKIVDYIEFKGYVRGNVKIEIFKNSHILILPSYTEGLPSTVLEAMAAGMAIVATPVGGLAETLKDKKQGLIIKSMPPNPEEIAEKIIELIRNPFLIKKMSENNLLEVKEKYDIDVIIKKFSSVYLKIAEKKIY